ncbi:HIT domain-containing protein [Pararhodospirillum oryzae]|uniref:HIT family protein n=1 Tax=Pararhodospirillum oryzae TaxID=478448 RepID=A0A512H5B7_9PROT|nr:HIT family protein [Pararhodospirillum oryzae]GEO80662.1 HIT family protein [Pararhodospirillum oryzae]
MERLDPVDLDPRLAADTVFVAPWPLCDVRLMNDARYPWLVLIPRCPGASEPFDLDPAVQDRLWREVSHAARVLKTWSGADKINVGALGNVVAQLHVHVVGRRVGDEAWPGPVWGQGTATSYPDAELSLLVAGLQAALGQPEDEGPAPC